MDYAACLVAFRWSRITPCVATAPYNEQFLNISIRNLQWTDAKELRSLYNNMWKWGDITCREMRLKRVSFKFKFKCRHCRWLRHFIIPKLCRRLFHTFCHRYSALVALLVLIYRNHRVVCVDPDVMSGHTSNLRCCLWLPQMRQVVSASDDKTVR